MEHRQPNNELNPQSYNPFGKFTERRERVYKFEDFRLLPDHNISSEEAIEKFLSYRIDPLHASIPRRYQALRDFMKEAVVKSHSPSVSSLERDIVESSSNWSIALVDDREDHSGCSEGTCLGCTTFSEKVKIAGMYNRLKEKREEVRAQRRIQFIPNLTSAGALTLAATVSTQSTRPLRDFLQRYIERQHRFSMKTTRYAFVLEFHIPYFAMRLGGPIKDPRKYREERLRSYKELPLRSSSKDPKRIYYYEAQISSLCLGFDDWFWTEYFLVDTYFGSENKRHKYFEGFGNGKGYDPPLGGKTLMDIPCFDPREYWLLKVDRRLLQVTHEFATLVDTFIKRIADYENRFTDQSADDIDYNTISTVVETTQHFSSCIDRTIRAWTTFERYHEKYFITNAEQSQEWQARFHRIVQYISELDRLRHLLIDSQKRFECKLRYISTVSSFIEANEARRHRDNLKTPTERTAKCEYPPTFTLTLFGMGFKSPPWPWLIFGVFVGISISNYGIELQKKFFNWRSQKE